MHAKISATVLTANQVLQILLAILIYVMDSFVEVYTRWHMIVAGVHATLAFMAGLTAILV
jgi:hypothetical protein